MATDYDTPRKTDDDVDSDSLEELKARRNDKSTSSVDVDEFRLPRAWSCPERTSRTKSWPSGCCPSSGTSSLA